jgi:hypothetical protein
MVFKQSQDNYGERSALSSPARANPAGSGQLQSNSHGDNGQPAVNFDGAAVEIRPKAVQRRSKAV